MLAAFSQAIEDLVITSSCGSLHLEGCLAVNRLKLGGRVKHEVDIGCDFQAGSVLGNVNQVVFHFSGSRAANFEILKPTEHGKGLCTQSPMLVTAAGLECQTIHTLSTCTFWLVSRWFPRALLVVVRVLCRTSCKSLGVWKLRATRCSSERMPREVACD